MLLRSISFLCKHHLSPSVTYLPSLHSTLNMIDIVQTCMNTSVLSFRTPSNKMPNSNRVRFWRISCVFTHFEVAASHTTGLIQSASAVGRDEYPDKHIPLYGNIFCMEVSFLKDPKIPKQCQRQSFSNASALSFLKWNQQPHVGMKENLCSNAKLSKSLEKD